MSEKSKYEEQVQKGIAKLDVVKPGWEKLINLNHLNMESMIHCILGQTHKNYFTGRSAVFLGHDEMPSWEEIPTAVKAAADHGFYISIDDVTTRDSSFRGVSAEYGDLTNTWIKAITDLRANERRKS